MHVAAVGEGQHGPEPGRGQEEDTHHAAQTAALGSSSPTARKRGLAELSQQSRVSQLLVRAGMVVMVGAVRVRGVAANLPAEMRV